MARTLSEEARDELLREAREGRLRATDVIDLALSDHQPLVGESVTLRWEVTEPRSPVILKLNGQVIQPDAEPVGEMVIQAGSERTQVEVSCGLAVQAVLFTPLWRLPKINRFRLDDEDEPVHIGESRRVHWDVDNAETLMLRLISADAVRQITLAETSDFTEIQFPEVGGWRLELTASNGQQELVDTGPCEELIEVQVIHPEPVLNADFDQEQVVLGETYSLRWSAENADRVVLEDDGGARELVAKDRLVFPADALGEKRCRVIAEGPGGRVEKELGIICVVPPVEIELGIVPTKAALGDIVSIRWTVQGAAHVELQATNGTLDSLSGPCGAAHFPAMSTDEFSLVAIGLDGKRHQRQCRLSVEGIAMPDIDQDLKLCKPCVFDKRPSLVGRVWERMKEKVA